jgi:hypothetical protein
MQALPIFTFLLAWLLFFVGVARNQGVSGVLRFFVISAGVLYLFTGCTSCTLWFQEISADLLDFIDSFF